MLQNTDISKIPRGETKSAPTPNKNPITAVVNPPNKPTIESNVARRLLLYSFCNNVAEAETPEPKYFARH